MAYFPLFVSLEGKQCLVIGGGKVALRKAKVLLEYGARLQIVAEELCLEMQAFAKMKGKDGCGRGSVRAGEEKREGEAEGGMDSEREGEAEGGMEGEQEDEAVRIFCREAKVEDAKGMDLVICASSDGKLHREIAAYCKMHRIPVNLADNQEESTFLFPALVRQEDVVLGITTGGNSPAASRYLREYIYERLPREIGRLVQQLGSFRKVVKEELPEQRMREEVFTRLFFYGLEHGGELREDDVRRMICELKEERKGKRK